MDPVNPKALKGKFKDREDKDIDNDGEVDSSDEYLHKRRQAVSKAIGKIKEAVELDEAKTDVYHKHMLKALGKTRLPKDHSYTSAMANNGDFVVHDGGGRVVGRIPKGEHSLNEVSDKKLDAYRQKAFADQPSGDDGSDKYRKRKFGRDLAFAKQTGRAKVLATKEEVELDEKTGLWDNIHAKRKRIEAGSGERMRKPGSEGAPTNADFKRSQVKEEVELDELSAVTLGKYSQKARTDALDHSGGPWGKKKDPARVAKRLSGDAMAVKKLDKIRKEEVDLDEAPNQNWADKEISHSREQERLAKQKEKTMKAKNAASRQFQKSSEIHAKTAKADHDVMKARRGQKIEEVELDEAKTDIYHKHMLKALGKSRLPKGHQYTSAIATNGDFVVKDGGGRVAGRIPKGDHNLNEVSDKKLDAYRQKAFADQPAGDDGSNKYRKRKFGRDLAFAKQTGRAKVLATKEEVDLDEVYQETANYLVSEGIELESLNEEQLNELIGAVARGIGRGLKSTVVNKKGNFRFSTAGRADAAQKRADAVKKRSDNIERLRKQRERLAKERERLNNLRRARSNT